jgi:predicted RNA-binding Zn-ribbon protein involved in translation (DUF1610 family)
MEIIPEPEDFPLEEVSCTECGWLGMNDDCSHNLCPYCGERVVLRKEEDHEKEIHRQRNGNGPGCGNAP